MNDWDPNSSDFAVFDLDGTLIEKNIGTTFVKYLMKNNFISSWRKYFLVTTYLLHKCRVLDFKYAIKMGYWAIAGLKTEQVADWADKCFQTEIRDSVYRDALTEISRVKKSGCLIVVATGAHEAIAAPFSNFVGADALVATQSVVDCDQYTMNGVYPLPYREGKRDLVKNLIESLRSSDKAKYANSRIIVYTDEKKDLPLLEISDHCFAVNSDEVIKNEVLRRGGALIRFQ